MEWDNKRILKKPRVNPWRTCSDSRPVTTAGRLTAAQEQGVIVNASRRRKRRVEARAKRQKVFMMLASNASVREISKATGVPRSTVQDMKRKLATHIEGFLGTQGIKMPEDVEK
jgi:transposase-like protein